MKQLLILLLSLTLCLGGLTACGGDKKTDPGTNSGSGSVIDPDGSLMDPEDDILENPSAPNASQPNGGSAGSDPSGNGSGSTPEGALNNGTVANTGIRADNNLTGTFINNHLVCNLNIFLFNIKLQIVFQFL